MTLAFGRLIPREDVTVNEAVARPERPAPPLPAATVAPKEVVEASRRAAQILDEARQSASALLARARDEARELSARVASDARAEANAAVAAHVLALAEREARADELGLERSIELARLLAERLLGESLAVEPKGIVSLAETALREARGARRIVLVAHPDDAQQLEQAVAHGRLEHVTRVVANSERARGAIRLESELGVLDAALAPQLDRLAERLRESLKS